MRLRAALAGDLTEMMRAETRRAEIAVTRAIRAAGTGLKEQYRAQIRAARLGERLGRTIRAEVYPRGESAGAAALVYSKASQIVEAFDRGATIRSRGGLWLAVPTPSAPRRGAGGRRLSPSNFPEHVYGPLRFVYRPRGPSLLVVDNQRERRGRAGGFVRARGKRALATGEGLMTVPMFWLYPQVRLRKRLDLRGPAQQWQERVPVLLAQEYRRLDATAGPS